MTEIEASSSTITAEGKLLPALAVELAFVQGGVIAEVLVKPGDTVSAGEVLARLIGFEIAQAELAITQAQYDQAYNTALAQEKSMRTQDWYKSQPGDFTLPLWYYDQQEQLLAAQSAVEKAEEALSNAQARLANVVQTTGADFVKVEADLNAAQGDYQVAKNLNDRVKNGVNMDEMTKRQLYLLQRDAYLKSKGHGQPGTRSGGMRGTRRRSRTRLRAYSGSALRASASAHRSPASRSRHHGACRKPCSRPSANAARSGGSARSASSCDSAARAAASWAQ